MTNEYFESLLQRNTSILDKMLVEQVRAEMQTFLSPWAGKYLKEVKISGSYAKGTNITSSSDFDIFVSFTPDLTNTNKEVYELLEEKLRSRYIVTRQNVSLGITVQGKKVDIIPGKNHAGNTNDHWLYSTKKDSYFQTNIYKHINLVSNSNRTKEIKITKVWSRLHGLDFPSFYLELVVIDALKGCEIGKLDPNFQTVLRYIAENLECGRVVDPANTNNIVSDTLTTKEKQSIAQKAQEGNLSKDWTGIVW